MKRWMMLCAGLALASNAWALQAGDALLSLQVGQGTADFVNPIEQDGTFISISRDTRGQLTGGGEFWYLFRDDYSFNVSAATCFFSEKDEPAAGLPAGSARTVKFTTQGYQVRIGGDRMAAAGKRLTLFFGPGVELWAGRARYQNVYATNADAKSAISRRLALSGRIGGIMHVTESIGIVGRIGTTFGYASASDHGAKTTWWPTGIESAWGLSYAFGNE